MSRFKTASMTFCRESSCGLNVLWFLLRLSLLASLFNLLPSFDYPFSIDLCLELNRSFSAYYFAVHALSLIVLMILLCRRCSRAAAVFAGITLSMLIFYAVQLLPFYRKAAEIDFGPGAENLSLLYANVFADNDQYHLLAGQINSLKPDLIVLAETTQPWLDALDLKGRYPFFITLPGRSSGLSVYSRFKISKQELVRVRPGKRALLLIKVAVTDGTDLLIGCLHANPPRSAESLHLRNDYLDLAAEFFSKKSGELLVVGDFNSTPFSSAYRKFVAATGLKDAMHGHGLQLTWFLRQIPLFYATIDHVFYQGRIRIKSIQSLPDIGSDHFPLFVKMQID